MKGIFTILNYYFSPGRWAAQWPLATAPAAVGDRNLQVGRLILVKECLRYGVDPFILDDKRRTAYYRGIARWDEDSSVLMETVLQAQARFQNQMETCMLMEYCRPANPRKL